MKSFIGAVIFICVAFSANAQLLWKVSGNGLTQPSYIIGTHHLAPFSIMDSIAGLQKAMNETQQVYGELKMSEMQSPATMGKMQKAMMIESDTTLTSLLSPEDFESANKFCKENLMVDLNMAPKLKPAFLLNNVVVMAYVKHVGKFNPQEQLDTFFQSQAAQNGKKVDGLETAEFQFNLLFNGSSLQRQAQLLMCTLNNIEAEVENGELLYGESHILCNLFSVDAIQRMGTNPLPYHTAFKKAQFIDKEGNLVVPDSPNAFKFEAFLFDAFGEVDDMAKIKIKREEEFAPVKNADDAGVDCPSTARKLYEDFYHLK